MSPYDDRPSMEELNEILEALDKATAGLGEHWPALDAARYLMFRAVKMLVREEGPEQASKTITMLMNAYVKDIETWGTLLGRAAKDASRAVREYLATLDDAAFGAASEVTPKFISPSDPAAQWTGAMRGPAFFAYANNYLIDVKLGVIVDVEASRAIRQAEVGAAKTMIERTEQHFDIKPERLAADSAYGSGANLNWLVNDKKIAPHIPVIDKSKREDGTFSRDDFTFDKERNVYICPAGKPLTTTGRLVNDGETLLYMASMRHCRRCPLKAHCCPKAAVRRVPRSIYEEARDVARALAKTEAFERSRHDRKRIEMLFAHLKRILRLGRLRLRGPCGAQFEFTLAAIAQNLRRLAKLVARPPPLPRQVWCESQVTLRSR
jgi:hypothetical protein